MESFYDHLGWLRSDVSWRGKFTSPHLALVRNVSNKTRHSSGHYGSKNMSWSWSMRKDCQSYQWSEKQGRETKTSFLIQLSKAKVKSKYMYPPLTVQKSKHKKMKLFNLNNKADTKTTQEGPAMEYHRLEIKQLLAISAIVFWMSCRSFIILFLSQQYLFDCHFFFFSNLKTKWL